ncbi:MAG TPA: GNAT family N-acetyltransferase [Candidatus Elarobacter sp.]
MREVEDAHFEWLLEPNPGRYEGMTVPPGGVDQPTILGHVRDIVRRLRAANRRDGWMVVVDDEVVGLCSYKAPPTDGAVEIGYGMAPSRWGRGYATAAVAAMLDVAQADPDVHVVVAETDPSNAASARVLEKNGFERVATRIDPKDGETIVWRKLVRG